MIAAALIAALIITHDEGGRVDTYAAAVASETRAVRIDGLCESACTMYLGASDVCVTERARLIFHRPRNGFIGELPPVYFWRAVDTITSFYPAPIASWYRANVVNGGSYKITGSELIRLGVKECQ